MSFNNLNTNKSGNQYGYIQAAPAASYPPETYVIPVVPVSPQSESFNSSSRADTNEMASLGSVVSELLNVNNMNSMSNITNKLTCENLPLATIYVRMQSYTNLNNSSETLREGTFFHDLYDVYTPKKVAKPYIYMHTDKGGRH